MPDSDVSAAIQVYQKTEQMPVLQQAKDRNNDDEQDKNLRNKYTSLATGFFC
jgi:hypothetical protein